MAHQHHPHIVFRCQAPQPVAHMTRSVTSCRTCDSESAAWWTYQAEHNPHPARKRKGAQELGGAKRDPPGNGQFEHHLAVVVVVPGSAYAVTPTWASSEISPSIG